MNLRVNLAAYLCNQCLLPSVSPRASPPLTTQSASLTTLSIISILWIWNIFIVTIYSGFMILGSKLYKLVCHCSKANTKHSISGSKLVSTVHVLEKERVHSWKI